MKPDEDIPCGIEDVIYCTDHHCNICFRKEVQLAQPDPKIKPKIDKYYQIQAKYVIDMLFDKGFLDKNVSRDDMDAIEEFLGYMFQSYSEMAANVAILTKKGKEKS